LGADRRLLECEPDHKRIVGPDPAWRKKNVVGAARAVRSSQDLTAFTRFRNPGAEVFSLRTAAASVVGYWQPELSQYTATDDESSTPMCCQISSVLRENLEKSTGTTAWYLPLDVPVVITPSPRSVLSTKI
jgi:hypothetical protein